MGGGVGGGGVAYEARSPGAPGPAPSPPTPPPGNPQPRAGMLLDLYLEEEGMNFLYPSFSTFLGNVDHPGGSTT